MQEIYTTSGKQARQGKRILFKKNTKPHHLPETYTSSGMSFSPALLHFCSVQSQNNLFSQIQARMLSIYTIYHTAKQASIQYNF